MEKQLCTASDTTVVAAGDKHSPLPFAPLWQVFVVMTGYFSLGYGLWMYWTVWRAQGMPLLFACEVSLIAGVLFGLTMALFHLWRRKVNKLPDWKDL